MENTYFQETEAGCGLESGAVNRLAMLRLNNFCTTTDYDHRTNTATADAPQSVQHCTACSGSMKKRSPLSASLQEPNPKKITLRPSSTTTAVLDGGECYRHGFTKLPLPITSPSNPLPSGPILRRCISDPINSPGTDKTRALGSQLSDSSYFSGVLLNPLSPENTKSTPSPAKASSSASVTLPPLPAILRRSVSDPIRTAYQVETTTPDSTKRQNPNSERMKRMKDRMREMRQWWDEVLCEGEEDNVYEDDKNWASKDERENESEEAVSVERSGNCLTLRIKCPCGKGFQVVLSGKNCYYQLM